MKKKLLLCNLLLLIIPVIIFAQTKENQLPLKIDKDTTLKANTTYAVAAEVVVSNGAVLTIEEGVILKGQKNEEIVFLIHKGAKVIASGSYDKPITAASNSSSDNAPVIIMKSFQDKKHEGVASNTFRFNVIQNPTILQTPKSDINTTLIGSVDEEF